MKVRKKPVEVDAVRYLGTVEHEDEPAMEFGEPLDEGHWLLKAINDGTVALAGMFTDSCRIFNDDHGELTCNKGDWVIRGLDGELYPCTDEAFQKVYEKLS